MELEMSETVFFVVSPDKEQRGLDAITMALEACHRMNVNVLTLDFSHSTAEIKKLYQKVLTIHQCAPSRKLQIESHPKNQLHVEKLMRKLRRQIEADDLDAIFINLPENTSDSLIRELMSDFNVLSDECGVAGFILHNKDYEDYDA